MRAGRLYLLLLLGTSLVLFLPAIVATWVLAGTLDFTPGGILAGKAGAPVIAALLALYVFGIGKAAVMPLHFWLPAAMVAPTPVSALLHAVAVVKAGVFAILKVVVLIFGIETLQRHRPIDWLTIVAGTTVLAASLVALRQDNLKRRLAYSTVSQLSYVVLGVAILAPISVLGAAMHLAAHAVEQDHAVLRRRLDLHRRASDRGEPARRHRPPHAVDDGRLRDRRARHDRHAADRGLPRQVVHPDRRGADRQLARGRRHRRQHAAQRRLFPADRVPRLLPRARAGHGAHAHGEAPWPIVLALTATAAGTVLLFLSPDIPYALARLMIGR